MISEAAMLRVPLLMPDGFADTSGRVAKGVHVVRNSCFYDMAAAAARPYDSIWFSAELAKRLNGKVARSS
jgi:hypothetical protein